MGRLIAFDQLTASALVANTRTAAQLGHGSPLKAALANEGDATLLMRAHHADELLVVNVRRQRTPTARTRVSVSQGRPSVELHKQSPTPPTMPTAHVQLPASTQSVRTEQTPTTPAPRNTAAAPVGDANRIPITTPVRDEASARPENGAGAKANDATPPSAETKDRPAARNNDMEPVAYQATGFLGLEDSPLYSEDLEPKAKKKWWQKLLE